MFDTKDVIAGRVAIRCGFLKREDAFACIQAARKDGRSFIDMALKTGLLEADQARSLTRSLDFEHTNPEARGPGLSEQKPGAPRPKKGKRKRPAGELPRLLRPKTKKTPRRTLAFESWELLKEDEPALELAPEPEDPTESGAIEDALGQELEPHHPGAKSIPADEEVTLMIHKDSLRRPPPQDETAPQLPRAGAKVDGYKIIGPVGQGRSGRIFEAMQAGQRYALRFILDIDPAALSRFEKESRIIRELRHVNIVRVHELSLYAGTPYLAMDFNEGPTLEARIRAHAPFDLFRALVIAGKLGYAMAAMHRLGIVHGALASRSVLMRPIDDEPIVVNFGFSYRVLATGGSEAALARSLSAAAPEVLSGDRELLGPQTDIWSLGIMLFEMCTGRAAFSGGSPSELADAIRFLPPPSAKAFNPQLPDSVASLIRRALHKDPADRFEDAMSFIAACRECIEELPEPA